MLDLGLEVVLALIGIFVTVIWVYADATKNKIGKIEDRKDLFNMSAGLWAFATLVLWIVFFPAYILKRKSLIKLAIENPVEVKKQTIKVFILVLVLFAVSVYLVLRVGLGNTVEIVMVKDGALEICPNHTVEQMVNSSMDLPIWTSGQAAEGVYFVNIQGKITYENKKAKTLLQFKINKKAGTYDYQALEINSVSQPATVASDLLKKMCNKVK